MSDEVSGDVVSAADDAETATDVESGTATDVEAGTATDVESGTVTVDVDAAASRPDSTDRTDGTGETNGTGETTESTGSAGSVGGIEDPAAVIEEPSDGLADPAEVLEDPPDDRSQPGDGVGETDEDEDEDEKRGEDDADEQAGDGDAGEQAGDGEAVTATDEGRLTTSTSTDGRWRMGMLFALVAGSGGVVFGNTGLFVSAIVGLVYAGYATQSSPPAPSLVVEREIDGASAAPGDVVSVTVTVRNAGSTVLPDVRVADQPPAELEVVGGDTRHAATFEPDEVVAFGYELRARRGKHAFDDVVTVAKGASGAAARRTVHETDDTVVCYAPFEAMDLAPQAGPGAGRVETDRGGEGIEFYATRRHDPSDPIGRIDWNRYATTGELATVVYRESHAATVVFVLDARHDVRPAPDEPTAVALGGYATVRIADALVDAANSVGLSVVEGGFRRKSGGAGWYLRPDTGPEQSLRIRRLLEETVGLTIDDLAGGAGDDRSDGAGEGDESVDGRTGGDESADGRADAGESTAAGSGRGVRRSGRRKADRWVTSLWTRIPAEAQIVFVSPLLDGRATHQVERFAASEHAVTVVSPDVTDGSTAGGAVERIERDARIRSLRGTENVRVVDWAREDSLQAAVTRDSAGWDR